MADDASLPRRIPSLDGLRAVAIVLVVFAHLGQRYLPGTSFAVAGSIFVPDGVGIFFVLSGYLITTLMVRELAHTGAIDLKAFYLRRTLRILPPLYVYLCAAFLLSLWLHLNTGGIAASLLFCRNLVNPPNGWLTEHVWSLSLEEQFYFLWPFAFVLAMARGGRAMAARLAAGLIVVAPLVRVGMRAVHLFPHREAYFLFGRMDALMCGCLLALVVGQPRFERLFARIAKVWWLLPLEYFILSSVLNTLLGGAWRLSVGLTLDSVCGALFILWCSRHAEHPVGRVLNSRVMVTLGVWSYSMYLWQTLFTHAQSGIAPINELPWSLGCIVVAAWASYTFVERPSFALRSEIMKRLSRQSTPGIVPPVAG